ncbi:MAG: hypothetical protein ABIT38_07700 [Gemmatimonadaceae bacterium]
MSLSYQLLLSAALAATPILLRAQAPAEEAPKNLQVLPKDAQCSISVSPR